MCPLLDFAYLGTDKARKKIILCLKMFKEKTFAVQSCVES